MWAETLSQSLPSSYFPLAENLWLSNNYRVKAFLPLALGWRDLRAETGRKDEPGTG